MKNFFKPARIAFYFLMLFSFFIMGLFYAGYIDAGKNQGLAGGAIVLGYGVMFGGVALLASFIIARRLEISILKIINWVLLAFLLITWGIKYYEFKNKEEPQNSFRTIDKILPYTSLAVASFPKQQASSNQATIVQKNKMGLGFFAPNFYEAPTLYFYGGVNLEKGMLEQQPQDSLVMGKDQHGNFISTYAPPYLLPEYMKLDYGLLSFKVLGVHHDLIKIEVNRQNKQVSYVSRDQGKLQYWPDFLLSMNSVKLIDGKQAIRIKPLSHAGTVYQKYSHLRPLLVSEEWMKVALLDTSFKTLERGWIRWKNGTKLLITFSFLS